MLLPQTRCVDLLRRLYDIVFVHDSIAKRGYRSSLNLSADHHWKVLAYLCGHTPQSVIHRLCKGRCWNRCDKKKDNFPSKENRRLREPLSCKSARAEFPGDQDSLNVRLGISLLKMSMLIHNEDNLIWSPTTHVERPALLTSSLRAG